ncbi:MAG: hypothetical protein ACYCUM_04975 [Solirubrobacteraceae bacterium]
MISFVRKRFTYANVAASVALVFAMTGGAFAANGGLGSAGGHHGAAVASAAKKQGKAKRGRGRGRKGKGHATGRTGPRGPAGRQGPAGPEGKQGLEGKQGPAGPGGATGPQGLKGAAGAAGPEGKQGAQGVPGAAGGPGASVALVNKTPSSCGAAGGFTYEIEKAATKQEVCNGAEGKAATALKAGETETGNWAVKISNDQYLTFGYIGAAPITFPVALSETAKYEVTYLPQNGKAPGCPGSPKAEEGHMCVYTGLASPATEPSGFDYFTGYEKSSHGVSLLFLNKTENATTHEHTGAGIGFATGTWAVNPEP